MRTHPTSAPDHPRLRVLVVDDEPLMRRAIRRALASGHDVVDLGDPASALRHLSEHPMDVLVTDVQMPEMSGCRLAELATHLQPGLRIALVTADARAIAARLRQRIPPVPVVAKPFDATALREAVVRSVALR